MAGHQSGATLTQARSGQNENATNCRKPRLERQKALFWHGKGTPKQRHGTRTLSPIGAKSDCSHDSPCNFVSQNIHSSHVKIIRATDAFDHWYARLKDRQAKARIQARIDRAEDGHFGDCAPVGVGVSEMRVQVGPGYLSGVG